MPKTKNKKIKTGIGRKNKLNLIYYYKYYYYFNNIKNSLENKIIPENIINSAKKLKLIVIQSKYIKEGEEYIINAGGLIGSPRNIKDGITYFGDKSVNYIII